MVKIDFNKLSKNRYAMSHDWDIEFPAIALEKLIEATPNDIQNHMIQYKDGDSIFKFRCKSSTMPTTQVTKETITVYGRTTQVITSASPNGEITFTFLESDKYELYKFFVAWREMCISSSTNAAVADRGAVSIDGVSLILAVDNLWGRKSHGLVFILNGVQPTNVNLSNLNEQIGFMTLTVALKYDDYGIDLGQK